MLGYIKAMKANLAAKVLSLAILFLAVAFIAGCRTTPPVDWNSRVGIYTYNQAVAEFGSPDKQTKLSDGKTVDQWITLHGSTGFCAAELMPAALTPWARASPSCKATKTTSWN